jgi:hypothetical protein
MDIATGVSMTATRRQLPKEEGRQVAERDMHPYFKKKKYRDNGEISSRIRKFHNTTRDKLSIVWIIDCCDQRSTYVVFSLSFSLADELGRGIDGKWTLHIERGTG